MGFSLELAVRYIRSKKRSFVSVGTLFAIAGVVLGVAALTTVVSVTGGFLKEFQDKVLGVNAHVLVMKYSADFREYRDVMKDVRGIPGVVGVAPFVLNTMMVTHDEHTATGVLVKGVDSALVPTVLDLPKHLVEGSLAGLRPAGAKPPARKSDPFGDTFSELLPDGTGSRIVGTVPTAAAPPKERVPVLEGLSRSKPVEDDAIKSALTKGKLESPSSVNDLSREATVEPVGGYLSQLPDDDVLPDDVIADPCKNPELLATLPGVAIGRTLKENLHLRLGECLQITSPTIGFSYSGGVIRAPIARQFRVVAVFDAGFDQYDSKLVYTDLYQAQAFSDMGDSVTGVELKLTDPNLSQGVSRQIEEKLGNGIYHTMDWEELNHGLFTALRIQQILISLVLALIIVVAAFTVIATLIMVVLEKKREIAVLKAMGATDGALLRVFIYQGGFIGLVGTSLGLALGVGLCLALRHYPLPLDPGVYFISRLPVQMRLREFAFVGGFGLLVCLAATIWPARYASRLRPAEAFRQQD